MKSLRTFLGFNENYLQINREERNLAAIFYHTLLINNNLNKFLKYIECDFPIIHEETGIYFEYSYIRDLWSNINNKKNIRSLQEQNDLKRKLILDFLKPTNRNELEQLSVLDFNNYFGAVRTPSNDYIASPGNWNLRYYDKNIVDNDEFLKTCKFKWSFNAKPDIVIHTTKETAICIEAKYTSGEGQYPSNKVEKSKFKDRFGSDNYLVGQLEIQQNIMKLLGIESKFLYLVQNKSQRENPSILEVSWKEVFENLDLKSCPYFINEWIKRLQNGVNFITN